MSGEPTHLNGPDLTGASGAGVTAGTQTLDPHSPQPHTIDVISTCN